MNDLMKRRTTKELLNIKPGPEDQNPFISAAGTRIQRLILNLEDESS